MTTSIRDLLDQVRQAQQLAQRPPAAAEMVGQAQQVITTAAGSLRLLQRHWRPDWSRDIPATQLVTDLAEACSQVHPGTRPRLYRPAQLVAVASDAIATMCGQSTAAPDRWVIATALADVITHAATTHRIQHAHSDDQVEAARQAALAILRLGRRYVPGRSSGILDLPITPLPSTITDPLHRAAAAAAVIERTLALAATDHTRPAVTVYELRAVCLAFQSTTELLGAELRIPTRATVDAWGHVRQLARRMRDGIEPAPDGPERLVRSCAQLHHGLRQLPHRRPQPDDVTTMQVILSRAAGSAERLAGQAHRLAGRVYAPARDYPVRETRVGELLRHQAVILDADDIPVLVGALEAAETTTARLITAAGLPPSGSGLGDYPMIRSEHPTPSLHGIRPPPSP